MGSELVVKFIHKIKISKLVNFYKVVNIAVDIVDNIANISLSKC